jgi:NADPH:quinone reductase-like Zn-dependent oxidoreductase
MARVVRFHRIGGPEVLQIEDLEVGDPGPGEVRIRGEAIGPNRAEAMFRSGTYLEQPRLPARLGSEASGTSSRGIPHKADGRLVGAVGVSEGRPDRDHKVVEAGVTAVVPAGVTGL